MVIERERQQIVKLRGQEFEVVEDEMEAGSVELRVPRVVLEPKFKRKHDDDPEISLGWRMWFKACKAWYLGVMAPTTVSVALLALGEVQIDPQVVQNLAIFEIYGLAAPVMATVIWIGGAVDAAQR